MRHWRLVGLVAPLALGATALLTILALFLSWQLALNDQRKALATRAGTALEQVEATYRDIAQALRSARLSGLHDCSPEHVLNMRAIVRYTVSVDDMAYGSGEIVECNSWGLLPRRLPLQNPGFTLAGGIDVTPNWTSYNPGRAPQMILSLAGHHALVDQQRFFGPPGAGRDIRVLAANGVALAHGLAADPAPAPELLRGSATAPEWTVTAEAPALSFAGYVRDASPVLIPILPALALLCAGLAVLMVRYRLSPSGELKSAIRRHEILVHYQPIIELATGRCVGAEALARWRRPNGDMVRPNAFIPLAEDTGLIQPITDQILDLIIKELGAMLRERPSMHIALNLCAEDISTGRILEVLERKLAGTGIAPWQIWLEATERSLLDIEGTHRTLAEARRRGHWTAIDDFGTGYSGLHYLQRLPVNALKIDKSFIDSLGTDASTRHVTEHIIGMARALNLDLIAEGIETESQAAYLREREVTFAQGWLFSRALPAHELIAFCDQPLRAAA